MLDEVFLGSEFARYQELLAEHARQGVFQKQPLGPSLESLQLRTDLFGVEVARRLDVADAIWFRTMRLSAEQAAGRRVTTQSRPFNVQGFVDDPSVPLEMRSLLLTMWHGLLAARAIQHLVLRQEKHVLAASLAEIMLGGARAAWRFVRGDFDMAKHERRETWVAESFAKAAKGDGYFSPSKSSSAPISRQGSLPGSGRKGSARGSSSPVGWPSLAAIYRRAFARRRRKDATCDCRDQQAAAPSQQREHVCVEERTRAWIAMRLSATTSFKSNMIEVIPARAVLGVDGAAPPNIAQRLEALIPTK